MSIGRVLLLDDDPGTREFLGLALGDEGFELIAITPRNSLPSQLIADHNPSLILLDISPPDRTAFAFLEAFRCVSHPPIIALSTGLTQVKDSALSLGATDFLAKPFDVNELLDLMYKYSTA
jgi:two-component system KDP operon response regulator KdpE